MTSTIVEAPIAALASIQSRLARIFRAATPNRSFLIRQITAQAIDAALRADAVQGSDRWITFGEALGRHCAKPILRDAFAHDSFSRGLLFYRAAILSPAADRRDPDAFQLTTGFARALQLDDAAIDAFQISVLRDCGIDIGAMSPCYD